MEHEDNKHDQGKSEAHLEAIAWHSERANERMSDDEVNPKALAAHVEAITNHALDLGDHLAAQSDKHEDKPSDAPTHMDVRAIVADAIDRHVMNDRHAMKYPVPASTVESGFNWPMIGGVAAIVAAIGYAVAKSHGLV